MADTLFAVPPQHDQAPFFSDTRNMNPAAAGILAFLCAFGGSILGLWLGRVLPKHHLENESKDVIRISMASVATVTALVLGLLIASAKQSFDDRSTEFRHAAVQTLVLDRMLAAYGPEGAPLRQHLKDLVGARLSQFDRDSDAVDAAAFKQGRSIASIQGSILRLVPRDDDQRWVKNQALTIASDIASTRWQLVEPSEGNIQLPFLAVVLFWLVVMFGSFGLFAPSNASVYVALLITALSIAGSIFIILEMDQPYGGLIRVSDAPMHAVFDDLGRDDP